MIKILRLFGIVLLAMCLCLPVRADDDEKIEALERAVEVLMEQNRRLSERISVLEAEKEASSHDPHPNPSPGGRGALERDAVTIQRLQRRVEELEITRESNEDATRAIIRDSVASLGSNINEAVALGGTLEIEAGWSQDFAGQKESAARLATAELDLEIRANDWSVANLVFEYNDGEDALFSTVEGDQIGVERLNMDTAWLTLGDPQRFPLFVALGRMIVPFGISTGNPVADVLTIENPLTIDAFEMREVGIGFGLGFPVPPLKPEPPPVVVPPVQSQWLKPLAGSLARRFGYTPPPARAVQTPVSLPPAPPPFNAGVYFLDGNTYKRADSGRWRPGEHVNATFGYRTRDHCGRPYHELKLWDFCPWTLDIDLDYTTSLFDSRFLEEAYRGYLGQIGYVPGMAVSVKSTLGALSLVGEYNGALGTAALTDVQDRSHRLQPRAWQLSLAYQFDWNPWVEEIGAQGSYVTLGYSESRDLAGVMRLVDGEAERTAFLPRRRLVLGVGEWLLDGLKLAIEYAWLWDYGIHEGGTGKTANKVYTSLTYVW